MVICQETHFISLGQDKRYLVEVTVENNPSLLGLLDLLQEGPVVGGAGGQLSQRDLGVSESFRKLEKFLQLDKTLLSLIENYEGLPASFPHKVSVSFAQNFWMRVNIDAEVRSGLDVVEVVHDEGDVEGVGEGLDVVGGGRGDGSEDSGHARPQQFTERLARLEAVISRVPLDISLEPGLGQDRSVLLDSVDGSEEGSLLGSGGFLEQSS